MDNVAEWYSSVFIVYRCFIGFSAVQRQVFFGCKVGQLHALHPNCRFKDQRVQPPFREIYGQSLCDTCIGEAAVG